MTSLNGVAKSIDRGAMFAPVINVVELKFANDDVSLNSKSIENVLLESGISVNAGETCNV